MCVTCQAGAVPDARDTAVNKTARAWHLQNTYFRAGDTIHKKKRISDSSKCYKDNKADKKYTNRKSVASDIVQMSSSRLFSTSERCAGVSCVSF